MQSTSTERFSSRVGAYLRYRPHYPEAIITALRKHTGLAPSHIIADIGSGTGFSTELFLANGNFVFGIEPNKEMREAGEKYLSTYNNFRSIDGTAEATTLAPNSVDYILAGQAFHWFKFDNAYEEFKRILRPNGWLVIIWNDRQTDASPFLVHYEKLLLEFGTDYVQVNHRNMHVPSSPDANIQSTNEIRTLQFFRGKEVIQLQFENNQMLDYDGLEGRLLSSSYVPNEGDANYQAMIDRLHYIFKAHAVKAQVDMQYKTLLYAGQL